MKRRPKETKYLSVQDYLEFEEINSRFNGSFEELDKFFAKHGLPTSDEIKEQNLRMNIGSAIHVEIFDLNQIKKVDSVEALDFN